MVRTRRNCDCEKAPGEAFKAYVDRIDEAYEAVRAECAVDIPEEIRAYMLLKRSGVERLHKSWVESMQNSNKKATLYEQMKNQIGEVL